MLHMFQKMKNNRESTQKKELNRKKRIVFIIIGVIVLSIVGFVAFKAISVAGKVSKGGFFKSLVESFPGVESELKGEEDGRINFLLLGMRGEHVVGGGLLADTIMVVSVKPGDEKTGVAPKFSMVSIPRDLYVTVPDSGSKAKINAVYAFGEEKQRGSGGIEAMSKIISDITGLPIQYAISIDFAGFEQIVDALDGVDIHLDQPFSEPIQFHEEKVCDDHVFTKPSGKFEYKKHVKTDGRVQIVAQYPLCYNPNEECGGVFQLAAGDNHLDGKTALCYVRARYTSSDFDRARRQQEVIQKIKDKALSIGTLGDFSKINGLFDALGDNVRTNMELWEMERAWKLFGKSVSNPNITQKVLEASEEGLLYHPSETKETGYILLPIGDTYDRIREMFKNILN